MLFAAFAIGVALLIALAIATVVKSRRSVAMNPIRRAVAILGVVASIVAVGITSVSSAASSDLPTLTLTLNGGSVAVSGALSRPASEATSVAVPDRTQDGREQTQLDMERTIRIVR